MQVLQRLGGGLSPPSPLPTPANSAFLCTLLSLNVHVALILMIHFVGENYRAMLVKDEYWICLSSGLPFVGSVFVNLA